MKSWSSGRWSHPQLCEYPGKLIYLDSVLISLPRRSFLGWAAHQTDRIRLDTHLGQTWFGQWRPFSEDCFDYTSKCQLHFQRPWKKIATISSKIRSVSWDQLVSFENVISTAEELVWKTNHGYWLRPLNHSLSKPPNGACTILSTDRREYFRVIDRPEPTKRLVQRGCYYY